MFTCRFCFFTSSTFKDHLDHRKLHSAISNHFHCGFRKCTDFFKTENNLRVHLIRAHGHYAKGEKSSLPDSDQCSEKGLKYICTVPVCKQEVYPYSSFIKHLKGHINRGLSIVCPYPKCGKKYELVQSFSCHLTRCHRSKVLYGSLPTTSCEPPFESTAQNDSQPEPELEVNYMALEHESKQPNTINETELFIENFALFSLKLETLFKVPISTIQFIISEIENMNQLGLKISNAALQNLLQAQNIHIDTIEAITKSLEQNNQFSKAYAKLKTVHGRKKLYKSYAGYVEPHEIVLKMVNGKKIVFHYVSILKSVKSMLNDKFIQSFLIKGKERKTPNVLADYDDGSVFRKNTFFIDNPEALQIILYQDEFEIVNPIGNAKKKYKLLAVYMTIGNLPDYLRSNMENIQLVALCRSKYFDPEKVYGQIVEEITQLEEGIEIEKNKLVKGSLVFIAGDNLGHHSLGGFVENFSKSDFFCRFCLITRKCLNNFCQTNDCNILKSLEKDLLTINESEVEAEASDNTQENDFEELLPSETERNEYEGSIDSNSDNVSENDASCSDDNDDSGDSESSEESNVSDEESCNGDHGESLILQKEYMKQYFAKRTPETYKFALSKIPFDKKNNFQGIKFDSVFNRLRFFHVCSPGLAPCLAHDLPEGVVAFDLALFTKYLVQTRGWFTYSELNHRIDNFTYSILDARDKPVPLQDSCNKISGGAWQVWTLLRLYPLLVGDKIKIKNDEVWLCLLKLIEILELVTAPSIHKSYVGYLQFLIDEYLHLRVVLFPAEKLRPKHHYLTHYPQLLLEFGNLVKVFTLRFESKHTFFKGHMRVLKNYKNVTFSLSEKHQLYQCLVRKGAGIRTTCEAIEEKPFISNLYSDSIKEAVYKAQLVGSINECSSIILKGTCYKRGDVVVVRQEGYNYKVEMGRILLLLNDETGEAYFVLELLETYFDVQLRIFVLGDVIKHECVQPRNLLSYQILNVYSMNTIPCIKLKYGLVASACS